MFLRGLWNRFQKTANKLGLFFFLFLIAFYKSVLSVITASGGCCRFYPSCSDYAFLAYKNRPFFSATLLVLQRLWACRPFGPKVREEPLFDEVRKQELF